MPRRRAATLRVLTALTAAERRTYAAMPPHVQEKFLDLVDLGLDGLRLLLDRFVRSRARTQTRRRRPGAAARRHPGTN